MKYCSHCGNEIMDEAVICPKCGCPVSSNQTVVTPNKVVKDDSSQIMKTIAKIFMVIGCISTGWVLIPLAWTLPMTISYFKKVDNGEKCTTGFKICSLIFVNLIAGILMLVDPEQ